MTQRTAVVVLFALLAATFLTGFHSYSDMKARVSTDMNRALSLALLDQPSDVITADTVRRFNHFLQMGELRGRATLAVTTRPLPFSCQARCSEATILRLSDQRPTLLLLALTAAWGLACLCRQLWRQPVVLAAGGTDYGGLRLADGEFSTTATGQRVRLTPMQHQLLTLFFLSPSHTLSKAEICDALWPKKTDASETLYALVGRLKPIVEAHSRLKIASDRGRAYRLVEQ